MKLFFKLFCNSKILRRLIIKYYVKKEHGIWRSITLREMFSKYKNIEAGVGSYGWESEEMKGPMKIGNYTSIGPGVKRFEMNHPSDEASTHPCWFNPVYGWVESDPRTKTMLEIGHDVWIGANAIILPGCSRIGNGAIVGAGAVVTKDIPPYEIWGGVPAKFIKRRMGLAESEALEKTRWWEMTEAELKRKKDLFGDINAFISSF